MNENMPTMLTASRSSTAYDSLDFVSGAAGSAGPIGPTGFPPAAPRAFDPRSVVQAHKFGGVLQQPTFEQSFEHTVEEMITMPIRRVVQVFIADPNENVPLEDCVLYEGKVHVTDLTDQELFFELDIKDMLTEHNAKRINFVDKKVKDRIEHLEPAKVRDLKMVVVTVANL